MSVSIDSHAHVFERSLPQVAERRYAPSRDALLADYLAHLDQAGLTHGVLVQPSFLGTDNSYMLSAIAAAKARLRGIAVVDASISNDALATLGKAGIVGIRFNILDKPTPHLAGSHWPRVFEFIRTHGWHVEVHGHAHEVMNVVRQLVPYEVRIVVDHFGRPEQRSDPAFGELLAAADTRRVWVKLSGAYRFEHADTCAIDLMQAFGPERLVWGSDWPHTTFEHRSTFAQARARLDTWVFDNRARLQVLGSTAAELFHIQQQSPS
jgi:predicted TIM-barrel fold metal-dependent hydrolase